MQGKVRKEGKVRESGSFYKSRDQGERNGRICPPASPSSHSPKSAHSIYYCYKEAELEKSRRTKKAMKQKQRTRSSRFELSTSSSLDEEGFGFFSSEETETFFSTRSFSSDSSEFYRRPSAKTNKTCRKPGQGSTKKKPEENLIFSSRRRRPRRRATAATETEEKKGDNFRNGFQPLRTVSVSEAERRRSRHEGFPVLKKSSDPYGDFRSSMAEMIVERQIFGARELERLLRSYLSLNSPNNHSAILRAFADISQVLFSY